MPTFQDVREISLALFVVVVFVSWGLVVFFWFVLLLFVIGGVDVTAVSIKASITTQAELRDLDPETFSKAAYVGRFGWVNVQLARVDRAMLEQLLRDAWRATAPAK